jgi:hypothetical protein
MKAIAYENARNVLDKAGSIVANRFENAEIGD